MTRHWDPETVYRFVFVYFARSPWTREKEKPRVRMQAKYTHTHTHTQMYENTHRDNWKTEVSTNLSYSGYTATTGMGGVGRTNTPIINSATTGNLEVSQEEGGDETCAALHKALKFTMPNPVPEDNHCAEPCFVRIWCQLFQKTSLLACKHFQPRTTKNEMLTSYYLIPWKEKHSRVTRFDWLSSRRALKVQTFKEQK